MITLSDKLAGGYWGLLIGDALGVPYEFRKSSLIPPLSQIEMAPPMGFNRAHKSVQPGTWSDDGAQALCLLDSILEKDELNLNHFARRLVAWSENGLWAVDGYVFDIGIQTSEAIRALLNGVPPEKAGFVRPEGKGNGSLMRVLPLALWHQGNAAQLVEDAHRQSVVTHGHITNQVCCALYCLWARALLKGYDYDDAYQLAVESLRRIYGSTSEYRKELETTIRPDDKPTTDGSGYVVSTLNCARLVLQGEPFENAVRKAIAYGEDTDTNAAVVGGLAGIHDGIEGIPQRWMETLRGRERAEFLLKRLQRRVQAPDTSLEYRQIPSASLTVLDIPRYDSGLDSSPFWQFTLSFNGYAHMGGDQCLHFGKEVWEEYNRNGRLRCGLTLDEIRSCLFFEQRRMRHLEILLDEEREPYIKELVRAMEILVKSDEVHD